MSPRRAVAIKDDDVVGAERMLPRDTIISIYWLAEKAIPEKVKIRKASRKDSFNKDWSWILILCILDQ